LVAVKFTGKPGKRSRNPVLMECGEICFLKDFGGFKILVDNTNANVAEMANEPALRFYKKT
jgi:hypothetical protein